MQCEGRLMIEIGLKMHESQLRNACTRPSLTKATGRRRSCTFAASYAELSRWAAVFCRPHSWPVEGAESCGWGGKNSVATPLLPVRERTHATCRQLMARQHFTRKPPICHQRPGSDPPTNIHQCHEPNPAAFVESFRDALTNQRAARGIPSSEPVLPGRPLVCPNPIARHSQCARR